MKQSINGVSALHEVMETARERMTSVEIAEITGKMHNDVMKAIRKMEPAWEKVNGGNFSLVEYRDRKGEMRPCYSLNKLECLYIATKFNDEARARLVKRWAELELKEQERIAEALHRNDDCLDYYRNVMTSEDTLTVRQVAFPLKMTAQELNKLLCQKGIQYGQSGSYIPKADYARRGYCKSRTYLHHKEDGDVETQHRTTWTERGIEFIVRLVDGWRRSQRPKVRVTQLVFDFYDSDR